MKTFCVYSKQLSSVADYINGKPFERDVECSTIHEARLEVARLEKIHPARFYFAGFNVGETYQTKNPFNNVC